MTTPLMLFAVFGVTGYVIPMLLTRARWPMRAPRLAVAAWLTLAISCALSAILAVATIALPASVAGHGLADLLNACLDRWSHYYGDTSVAAVTTAGAVSAFLVGTLVRAGIAYRRSVTRFRATHQAGLALLSSGDARNVVIVPHPVPTAYCVPGRPAHIVMTDAAVRILDSEQFEAVVAHEQAHLTGRHSLLVGTATVLQNAFGVVAPIFRSATRETAALVEMIADEAAVTACSPLKVADALFTLAGGAAPRAALSASGPDLARRVRRLITPPRPLATLPRLATLALLSAAFVLPSIVVVAPVAVAVVAATCAHPNHD